MILLDEVNANWRKVAVVREKYLMLIEAKDCRDKSFLKKIPSDKPGWYKWYATIEGIKILLNSSYIKGEFFSDILPLLTKIEFNEKIYYCIYVGQAVKGSIQARLDWHINQKHTKAAVESGFLSTFRKTISSLVAGDQTNEQVTNNFIDTLLVDYNAENYAIKSDEARRKIDGIENMEMNDNVLPLNIKGNKHKEVADFIKELKQARKNSKKIEIKR